MYRFCNTQVIYIMIETLDRQMAMNAKMVKLARADRTPPRQPDYPDELTQEQLDAIRKLADEGRSSGGNRTLLHASAW